MSKIMIFVQMYFYIIQYSRLMAVAHVSNDEFIEDNNYITTISSPPNDERSRSVEYEYYSSSSGDYTIQAGDTPDPSIHYSEVFPFDHETTEGMNTETELQFTKTLLNGTAEEVRKLDRNTIVRSLLDINKIQISLDKKLILWEILKGNKSVNSFTRADLERTGNILLDIPELDLLYLNYSDWTIIDYLGTLNKLRRRRAGVIGLGIKQRWGEDILINVKYINRIKGLICGFSPYDLREISTSIFVQIECEVFENIEPCTARQLQVLLNTAVLTTAYGPPQAWTAEDTSTLALLLKALTAQDLKTLRPEAMEGIDYRTIEAMRLDQLEVFTPDQLSYLSDLSLATYRRLTGINSNANNADKQIPKLSISYTLVMCLQWQFTLYII